ncbi:exosortase-associated protein EpsI, B-type [Chitinibacteraceae bacterium HSL-7]
MKSTFKSALVLMAFMFGAAYFAYALTPRTMQSAERKVVLTELVPKQVGEWTLEPDAGVIEPSPELQEFVRRTYSETVSYTYKNPKGERIMLSVAYGANQSDGSNIHRPEVCYPAQGFSVGKTMRIDIDLAGKPFQVNALVATAGLRVEPISYWMVVGDQKVLSSKEGKVVQVKMGLQGVIPDGLLFRVSSIGDNFDYEQALQADFVKIMFQTVKPENRPVLFGRS